MYTLTKNLLIRNEIPLKTNKNYVEYSYATPNYLYVLYKDYNSKNRDMYVLTLSTKTGNILGIVPLSKLLGNPKETNRHYLNYPEMQTTDDFIWCTEIDKKSISPTDTRYRAGRTSCFRRKVSMGTSIPQLGQAAVLHR